MDADDRGATFLCVSDGNIEHSTLSKKSTHFKGMPLPNQILRKPKLMAEN